MGMPTILNVPGANNEQLEPVFEYLKSVDEKFSPFIKASEVNLYNQGMLKRSSFSEEMKEILTLAKKTKKETNGYFDVFQDNRLDPSGIVKGWAIHKAAIQIYQSGFVNYYVEVGGDIEVSGKNEKGDDWLIGIRDPFKKNALAEVVRLTNCGIATSGTYLLGQHIYNPHLPGKGIDAAISLSVIADNVYEADRIATAAFAMGRDGIPFIEKLPNFEGYQINRAGGASMTSGFKGYLNV
jgi:thiamine biosynthesis lipoprotein